MKLEYVLIILFGLGTLPKSASAQLNSISYVGIDHRNTEQEEAIRWGTQIIGLAENDMHSIRDHLIANSVPAESNSKSDDSFDPWGYGNADFDLTDILDDEFNNLNEKVSQGWFLQLLGSEADEDYFLSNNQSLPPIESIFVGFKFSETWSYSRDSGFEKTIHRINPMVAIGNEKPSYAVTGSCSCGVSKKRGKPAKSWDLVVDVPMVSGVADEVDALGFIREMLIGVTNGDVTVVRYELGPTGMIPVNAEREEVTETWSTFDLATGEKTGSVDTTYTTRMRGDEFGGQLPLDSLRSDFEVAIPYARFDLETGYRLEDILEIIPITASSIGGLRFYETWSLYPGRACIDKEVSKVVFLLNQYDGDGFSKGYSPMRFALSFED